jgi:hypothetical protein
MVNNLNLKVPPCDSPSSRDHQERRTRGVKTYFFKIYLLPKGATAAYKPSDFDLAKGAVLDIGCKY